MNIRTGYRLKRTASAGPRTREVGRLGLERGSQGATIHHGWSLLSSSLSLRLRLPKTTRSPACLCRLRDRIYICTRLHLLALDGHTCKLRRTRKSIVSERLLKTKAPSYNGTFTISLSTEHKKKKRRISDSVWRCAVLGYLGAQVALCKHSVDMFLRSS